MNPSPPRLSNHLVDAARAGMLLAGSAVVFEGAWAILVYRSGVAPVPARLVAGLIAALLTVLVAQYGYRSAPAGARSMVARGVATIVFAAAWGALLVFLTRRFPEPLRPYVAGAMALVLFILGRWPRQTSSSDLRFGQDPPGASALVVPLLLGGAAAMGWLSHPTIVKVVWHSVSTSQTPAALWLGIVVGATSVPFVMASILTAWRGHNPAWPVALATLPALGSALVGTYLQAGPALYPQSLRIEEQAASIASRWFYSSQMTAAGFYASTLLLLVAGAASALAARREGSPGEPRRRQTIVAMLGPILVVAVFGAWLRRAEYKTIVALQYDMILLPAAVAVVSLAIVHGAAGAKVAGKHAFAACLSALLALCSFALAQALPAGSNADVLDLGPFEWVVAAENLLPKLRAWFLPAISYVGPIGIVSIVALRGLSFSWKNVLLPAAPGLVMIAMAIVVASRKTNHDQDQLARAFGAHVPADVTLASGPPGSLTSCTDLSVDKILFVGREHVTLNGQTIAATRDLDKPRTCADIAQQVKAAVPRLAIDESISFRQTTCLLDALAHREPHVCNVMFVGRCKAGTRVDQEDIPACTEHLQNSVPFCTERVLDVDGCPAADAHGPCMVLTPQHVHLVGWREAHAPDPWPAKPIEDDGRWKNLETPRFYWTTLGVTDDTSMGGFMALALQSKYFRLQLSTPAAAELPKPPAIVNPLGMRVDTLVSGETEKAKEVLEGLLKRRKSDLRKCLEPEELPWFYAMGRTRGLLGRDGNFVGTWAERNPDGRFGSCVAKILGEMRAAPMEQPALAEIRVSLTANLPHISLGAEAKPKGVRVNPPNNDVYSEVSYWVYGLGRLIEYHRPSRAANIQCLLPALRRGSKPRGTIDFDVFVEANETRVKARSKDIEESVVTCVEKTMTRLAKDYFQRQFEALPQMLQTYRIDPNTKFQASLDIAATMYIDTPENADDLSSNDSSEP